MTTPRQAELISLITPVIAGIADYAPVELVQRDRLGEEMCFEKYMSLFIDVTSETNRLKKLNFERISYAVMAKLQEPLQNINSLLSQIQNFSPSAYGNAVQARDNLANSLEEQWGNIYLIVRTLLGAPSDENVRQEIDALTSQIRTTMQLSSDALATLNSKRAEAEQTVETFLKEKASEFEKTGEARLKSVTAALEQVRKAAAEAGVSQNSTHFNEEATEHRTAARNWLIALSVTIGFFVGFSLFGNQVLDWTGTTEPESNASNFVHIKYLTQKGLVVFCLLFALVLSAKNYGAARHNYVVNKHRTNALGSFQAFAASATDDQTKSAVLIQATQSIFAPQPSGYIKSDGDNSQGSPVIEILRTVGSAKEK